MFKLMLKDCGEPLFELASDINATGRTLNDLPTKDCDAEIRAFCTAAANDAQAENSIDFSELSVEALTVLNFRVAAMLGAVVLQPDEVIARAPMPMALSMIKAYLLGREIPEMALDAEGNYSASHRIH